MTTVPAQVPAPPATPLTPAPPWEQELTQLRLLQGAAALSPAPASAAEAVPQQERVAKLYRDLAARYAEVNPVQRAAGDYFNAAGNAELALQYWTRARALDPKDASSADSLGEDALRRGNVREARRQFQCAVDAGPENAGYHFDLANVLYLFRHDFAESPDPAEAETALVAALAQFQRASDLAPQDARLAQAYAETFYVLAQPDWTQALAAWQRVRSLNGPATDFANTHLARVSLHLGRLDDAGQYLDLLHDPQFDAMKTKLRANIETARRPPARTPAK